MFYLTIHSTHFIYGYIVSDIWYRTIQVARGNPLPDLHGLFFHSFSSKGSFMCTIPQDSISTQGANFTVARSPVATQNSVGK